MVVQKQAACGTPTAYNRHIRRGETPCDACRSANAAYKREWRARRDGRGQADVVVEIARDDSRGLSRVEELEQQRDLLRARLHDPTLDPRFVSAISKELRAVWAEIDELGKGEGEGLGSDPLELIVGGASVVPFSSA